VSRRSAARLVQARVRMIVSGAVFPDPVREGVAKTRTTAWRRQVVPYPIGYGKMDRFVRTDNRGKQQAGSGVSADQLEHVEILSPGACATGHGRMARIVEPLLTS